MLCYNQSLPGKWTRQKKFCLHEEEKNDKNPKTRFVHVVPSNQKNSFEHKLKWYFINNITQKYLKRTLLELQ